MFRDDIFGIDVGRFIFRNIGDDLATCTAHSSQERSQETVESVHEITDSVPPL